MKISVKQLRNLIAEETKRVVDKYAPQDEQDEIVDQIGDLIAQCVEAAAGDAEYAELSATLKSLGATPVQIEEFEHAVAALEQSASEAVNSAELHNQDDWNAAQETVEQILHELGVSSTLDDFEIYFPVEQWEENLEDKEDDEDDEDDEDED